MSYQDTIASLIINEVFPEDAGTYSCEAVNDSGSNISHSNLRVQGALSETESLWWHRWVWCDLWFDNYDHNFTGKWCMETNSMVSCTCNGFQRWLVVGCRTQNRVKGKERCIKGKSVVKQEKPRQVLNFALMWLH